MGVYWLMADESAAAAISISESRGVFDWSSLSMAGLQKDDLATLWTVIREPLCDREAATGFPLAKDVTQGTSVSRVNPAFVFGLARLKDPGIEQVAVSWGKSGRVGGYSLEGWAIVLRELASFAGSAWDEGSPVLQVVDDL